MNFGLLFVELVLSYVIASFIVGFVNAYKEAKAELAKTKPATELRNIPITIEVIGDIAYFYNTETSEFVMQASSFEEWAEMIHSHRFIGTNLSLQIDQVQKVTWMKQLTEGLTDT